MGRLPAMISLRSWDISNLTSNGDTGYGRDEYAAALGITKSKEEYSMRDILTLAGEIGALLEGKSRTHAALATLAIYYFISNPQVNPDTMKDSEARQKTGHDVQWFLEEGSFQLAALIAAKRAGETGPKNGLQSVAN